MWFSATPPIQWSQAFHRVGRTLVDGVLPPRCLACGETVGESRCAPELGQDTEAVLLELGYSWEDIARFKEAGAIG